MAHFAQLDENNVVIQTIVVNDIDIPGGGDVSNEEAGIKFIHETGLKGTFKQTSYNRNFRKNYAGVGYAYDVSRDAFIPPARYPSWILNEETCTWDPPVAHPNDGRFYAWNEVYERWDLKNG